MNDQSQQQVHPSWNFLTEWTCEKRARLCGFECVRVCVRVRVGVFRCACGFLKMPSFSVTKNVSFLSLQSNFGNYQNMPGGPGSAGAGGPRGPVEHKPAYPYSPRQPEPSSAPGPAPAPGGGTPGSTPTRPPVAQKPRFIIKPSDLQKQSE